jgi:hypothetical protein
LDTGSSTTAVASWILQQLGIPRKLTVSSHTAAGVISVALSEVILSITDPTQAGSPMLTRPTLVVSELATVLPDADVLIGLDVLLQLKLVVDGPAGWLAHAGVLTARSGLDLAYRDEVGQNDHGPLAVADFETLELLDLLAQAECGRDDDLPGPNAWFGPCLDCRPFGRYSRVTVSPSRIRHS